jgi:hypothetical protein
LLSAPELPPKDGQLDGHRDAVLHYQWLPPPPRAPLSGSGAICSRRTRGLT